MTNQEIHPYTEIISKKQRKLKNQSRQAKFKALAWLAKKFPEVFDNTQNIRPLKKGIMQDVLEYADEAFAEAGISKSKLREALVIFTRRIDYLTALKAREMRVDLDGNPVEQVNAQDALNAAARIKKIIEKNINNIKKMQPTAEKSNFIKSFSFDSNNIIEPEKTTVKSPQITIKSKLSRKIDPEAVSRLKAKLGLTRETEVV